MHRIDHSTRAIDLHGTGEDGFTGGDPTLSVPATVVTADWLNDLQENVARAVEGPQLELVKGDRDQLRDAIRRTLGDLAVRNWATPRGEPAGVLLDVVHDGDRWVGVGEGGAIETSVHLVEWAARSAAGAFADDFLAVASGFYFDPFPTRVDALLAVGEGGEIQRSIDGGATWAQIASGHANTLREAVFGASQFWLVGDAGTIQTTPDGLAPTTRTPHGSYSGSFRALAVRGDISNHVAIAVGESGEIQRSTDQGATWSPVTAPTLGERLDGVAYGAGLWVAVGQLGTMLTSSDDGLTWEATGGFDDDEGFRRVLHDGQHWVVVGSLPRPSVGSWATVWVSRDGSSWQPTPVQGGVYSGLARGPSQWLAVGNETVGAAIAASLRDWR